MKFHVVVNGQIKRSDLDLARARLIGKRRKKRRYTEGIYLIAEDASEIHRVISSRMCLKLDIESGRFKKLAENFMARYPSSIKSGKETGDGKKPK